MDCKQYRTKLSEWDGEFNRYFEDSGASAALQKAIILLYRMPIKPTNIAEFFASYFESGAQELVRLSLLQAELCYKYSETEDIQRSIKYLEEQIQELQPNGEEDPVRESLKEVEDQVKNNAEDSDSLAKYQVPLLSRFLKDLNGAPRGSLPASEVSSLGSILLGEDGILPQRYSDFQLSASKIRRSVQNKMDAVIEVVSKRSSHDLLTAPTPGKPDTATDTEVGSGSAEYNFPSDCLPGKDSETAIFHKDVKTLDPWGLICKLEGNKGSPLVEPAIEQPYLDARRNSKEPTSLILKQLSDPDLSIVSGTAGSLRSFAGSDKEFHKYDSDDAETLAEIYQMASLNNELALGGSPSEMQLGYPSFPKIRSVLQPIDPPGSFPMPKPLIGDLLGWSKGPGLLPPNQTFKPDIDIMKESQQRELHYWSDFINSNLQNDDDAPDEIPLDQSAASYFKRILGMDGPSGYFFGKGTDADLLLQKKLGSTKDPRASIFPRAHSKSDFTGGSRGFNYDFKPNVDPFHMHTKLDPCAEFCGKSSDPHAKQDEATMTTMIDEPCLCEDCTCDAPQYYKPISPGKMHNWTNERQAYPEDDDDFFSYGETIPYRLSHIKKRSTDPPTGHLHPHIHPQLLKPIHHNHARMRRTLQLFMDDFEMPVSTTTSSCFCGDKMSPSDEALMKEQCLRLCSQIPSRMIQPSTTTTHIHHREDGKTSKASLSHLRPNDDGKPSKPSLSHLRHSDDGKPSKPSLSHLRHSDDGKPSKSSVSHLRHSDDGKPSKASLSHFHHNDDGKPSKASLSHRRHNDDGKPSKSSVSHLRHSDNGKPSKSSVSHHHHNDDGKPSTASVSHRHHNDNGKPSTASVSHHHHNDNGKPSTASVSHHHSHDKRKMSTDQETMTLTDEQIQEEIQRQSRISGNASMAKIFQSNKPYGSTQNIQTDIVYSNNNPNDHDLHKEGSLPSTKHSIKNIRGSFGGKDKPQRTKGQFGTIRPGVTNANAFILSNKALKMITQTKLKY